MKIPNPRIPESPFGGDYDFQKVFLIFLFFFIGFLVFLGDQICFVRSSQLFWESWAAYPTAWGYRLFEDRLFSNAFAFSVWSGGLGSGATLLMLRLERDWIEPMMAKKAMDQLKREKKWINRYGEELF